jgi:RNA-binding protein
VLHLGKAGLSEEFLASTEAALNQHELVKIRFANFKEEKKQLAPELAEKTGSRLIQRVGNVAVIYRQNPDPVRQKISL